MNLRELLILVLFTLGELAIASPRLTSRQEPERFWGNIIEYGVEAGGQVIDDLGNAIQKFPERPVIIDPKPPIENIPNTEPQGQKLPPPYKLKISTDQCDPNDASSSKPSCGAPTAQIIYPLRCAPSDDITAAINKIIKPRTARITRYTRCGVRFWAASLTPNQKSEIVKIEGVKGVARNRPLASNSFVKASSQNKNRDEAAENQPDGDGENPTENVSSQANNYIRTEENVVGQDQDEDKLTEHALNPDHNGVKSGQETPLNQIQNGGEIAKSFLDHHQDETDFSETASDEMRDQNKLKDDSLQGDVNQALQRKRRRSDNPDRIIARRDSGHRNLAFLSTAIGNNAWEKEFYFSFESSGRGLKAYLINNGVEGSHHSFTRKGRSIIYDWLFAQGAGIGRSDQFSEYSSTCDASIIVGTQFGVVTESDLIIVKTAPTIESLLDGWVQVMNDLERRETFNRAVVKGYTVVESALGWYVERSWAPREAAEMLFHAEELRNLIWHLMSYWRAVVVVPAGIRSMEDYVFPMIPAIFATEQFPLIVVGAVEIDGASCDWSIREPSMAVSAPYYGMCAGRDDEETLNYAASIPAAHGGGLALYFLGLPGLGDRLRTSHMVATAMRDFMFSKAYVRRKGTVKSLWNGLDPSKPDLPNLGWSYE